MLRACAISTFAHSRLLQPSPIKQITSKLRSPNAFHCASARNYAVKVFEEDNNLEKIYYGPLSPQIRAVKVFSLSSSVAGLIAQPIIIREAATIGSTSLLVALCSIVGFFTFLTPLLLHAVTKKYVIEMRYDPKTSTYQAITMSFFLARKKLDFNVEDVEVPDIPGMFTTIKAKGIPLFIEARHFNNPMHYAKIMGYDKPMDFKLGQPEESENK